MDGGELVPSSQIESSATYTKTENALVTFKLGKQYCGLPILQVRDILVYKELCRVPLSPKDILGAINIRGRIVTVMDLRMKLGLPPTTEPNTGFCLIIEDSGNAYGLRVDSIGDITNVTDDIFEKTPSSLNIDSQFTKGVYRTKGNLLLLLNVDGLFKTSVEDEIEMLG